MTNCCPTMPVAPRMPTSTLRETTTDSFQMMAGLKPCATPNLSRRSAEGAKADQKKTRRLLSVGGLLNLVRFAGYASSAHTPPTRLVPFDGTRFRPFDRLRVVPSVVEGRAIGLVVRANIV